MGNDSKDSSRTWQSLGWIVVLSFMGCGVFWWFHVPSVGKGGLLLAVGATLMPLFWDKMKVVGKMFWVGMLFVLLFTESHAIDNDHVKAAAAEQTARNFANQELTSISFLMLQNAATENHLKELDRKMGAAKGNPQLIATLQGQVAGAQVRASKENRQLLLALAPGIIGVMESWARQWDSDDRVIFNQINIWKYLHVYATQQETDAALAPFYQKRKDLDANNTKQVFPIITSANYLRNGLLADSEPTIEDKKMTPIFDTILAGEPINWSTMWQITTYMEKFISDRKVQAEN